MKFLLQIWAIFVVAIKRLYAQKSLAVSALLGLVAAIALTLSVPLYADAVYFRVLKQELVEGIPVTTNRAERSPFAFMFRYVGAWKGPVSWEDVQPIDTYFTDRASSALGLPRELMVRYFKTDNFRLFPQDQIAYASTTDPLAWISFGYVSGIEDRLTLLEGNFPAAATPSANSVIDVALSETLAIKLGLQTGESYIAFAQREIEGVRQTIQIPVRIAGIWKAKDPTDPAWFYTPSSLDEVFLVPEETFFGRISPYVDDEIDLVLWYMVMDGNDVHAADAAPLLRRITAVQQQASALLPGIGLDISPVKPLQRYQQASSVLTVLLYAFSVPILALILTFISLVVGLSVSRQRNEIAVLRSRGATIGQVVGIATLEALLLGMLALVISVPISEVIADLMGRTSSFLNFEAPSDLRVNMTLPILQFGLVAVGLTLIAQLVPTFGAARYTIVTYKQNQARSMQSPLWQRLGLDLILLIPAGYGAYLLQQQGSIVSLGTQQAGVDTAAAAFQNPLLFFVPALGIFALTLLFLRILPLFMSLLAWVLSYMGGVGILLAARQLSRNAGFYTAPMILLVLTLSLSAFTASLAQTLDNHLYDQFYYRIGADVTVSELGENTDMSSFGGGPGGGEAEAPAQPATETGPRWLFLPVSEYLKVPGVEVATRVGRYDAFTLLSGGRQEGEVMGIDRIDFPRTAFWRNDFSPYYLGELMNALAVDNNGVLIPRRYMREHALNIGDTILVTANIYGQRIGMDMKVVGSFDLFPTWYPEGEDAGPLFVTNLDYLFEQAQGEYPYQVWLKTQPGIDYNKMVEDMRALKLRAVGQNVPELEIFEEQLSPERQGLFGVLSVGFAAAAILTVLGFILYALFSFRQRFIELGVLRAVGLSSFQMTLFLAWELAFLVLTGLLLGTGLGIWASDLFIPSLQVGADVTSRFPPFLVEIAWPAIARISILFGLLFVAALAVLTTLLMRMKIFQAIKLGETV